MAQLDPTRMALFDGLPRVTLARLLPDLEVAQYGQDDLLPCPQPDRVYLVGEGQIMVEFAEPDQTLPIYTIAPGDMIIRPADEKMAQRIRYHCITPVYLVTVPRQRLEDLARDHPAIAGALHRQLASRVTQTETELVRTRRLLSRYVRELWESVADEQVAAAELAMPGEPASAPASAPPPEPVKSAARGRPSRRPWVSVAVNVACLAGAWFGMPHAAHPAYYLLAIFGWAGVNWALGTLPDHVVALAAAFACVLVGIVSFEVAFSGFASGSWWMILAVLGVVTAVTRTGLVYRLALAMLRLLPPTYWWQSLALAVTGMIVTPLLPSLNSRMSIVGPLASELADAMQLPPRSRGSAGLAMSTYVGTAQTFFLFLNGAQTTILLWSILSPDIRKQVTWGFWLVAALPMTIVLLLGFMALLFLFFRPEGAKPVARSTVKLQQAVLGQMSRQEWLLIGLVAALLIGFITEPWHGISSTWPAVAIFLVLMSTGLLNKEGLKQIDWSLTIYLGAVSGLTAVATKVGFNQTLTDMIAPWVTQMHLTPKSLLIGTALLTIVCRLAAPPAVVTVVLTVALEPVARMLGISPFAVGLTVVAFCSSWLVPQQWSVYLHLVHATKDRCFTHSQVKALAWANNVLLLLGLLASFPLWRTLGLMP